MEQENTTQENVQRWFDSIYQTQGLSYLRPPEAYPVFLQLLGVESGQSILDVACGPGLLLREACQRGLRAHGIDISTVALAMTPHVAPNALALAGNAEALPFADGVFDYVTCIGSVERFLNRERALQEMRRVAKPTAWYCIMVRNSRTLSWKFAIELLHHQNHAGHQDADTLESWSALFQSSGFIIDSVLPDQWFRQRLRRLIPRPSSATRQGSAARRILPLRFANEFIFILRT
jgi:ubiquinone/menaquinone biosynthesis C-methylase UbiE